MTTPQLSPEDLAELVSYFELLIELDSQVNKNANIDTN